MPFASLSDGVSLFYTDDGADGPPIVLLHGWTCASDDWIWQIPELARRYRVIAVDLRGHGSSTVTPGGYCVEDYAADIRRLIDVLDCGPAIVVGHSLGAVIGAKIAIDHPDIVRASVAVDPAYGPSFTMSLQPESISLLYSEACLDVVRATFGFLVAPATPAHLVTWYQRRLLRIPQHVIADSIAGMISDGAPVVERSGLRQRRCPTLTFYRMPSDGAWEETAFGSGPGKVVIWEGSGHWLHQERPAEFNAVLTEWLDAL
jgi:pimeloyl-ACP methyl ester carboxylesterase